MTKQCNDCTHHYPDSLALCLCPVNCVDFDQWQRRVPIKPIPPQPKQLSDREVLRNLVNAIEKAGDWDEETRVGKALTEANKVLND